MTKSKFDQHGLPVELVLHGKQLGVGNHEDSVLKIAKGEMDRVWAITKALC